MPREDGGKANAVAQEQRRQHASRVQSRASTGIRIHVRCAGIGKTSADMPSESPRSRVPPNERVGPAAALPNLIVIGAMKCGTSSMHNYLAAHPEIAMSRQKELNFFSFDRHWQLGVNWYGRHFTPSATIRGESSPSYSKFPHVPKVPERMKTLVPEAKLIYLVRDPIDRLVSHYMHVREDGRERRPIDEALARFEDNPYVDCSRYDMQFQRYLRHFPQSQILVVSAEEMREDRDRTLRTVFRFLGVDDSFRSSLHDAIYHVSGRQGRVRRALQRKRVLRKARPYVPPAIVFWAAAHGRKGPPVERPRLAEPLREALRSYLREDIERFRTQLGREFATWSL